MISKIVSHQVAMRPMTSNEHKLYEAATECVNCGGLFSNRNLKVRHHDHVSGEYLLPACQKCNLQLKPRKAGKKRKYCSDAEAYSHMLTDFGTTVVLTPTALCQVENCAVDEYLRLRSDYKANCGPALRFNKKKI